MPPKKYPPKAMPGPKKPDKSLPKESVTLKDSDGKPKRVEYREGGLRKALDFPDNKPVPKSLMERIAKAKDDDEITYLAGKKKIKVTPTLRRQAVLGLNLMKGN
jgi:hypothetical protein